MPCTNTFLTQPANLAVLHIQLYNGSQREGGRRMLWPMQPAQTPQPSTEFILHDFLAKMAKTNWSPQCYGHLQPALPLSIGAGQGQ